MECLIHSLLINSLLYGNYILNFLFSIQVPIYNHRLTSIILIVLCTKTYFEKFYASFRIQSLKKV